MRYLSLIAVALAAVALAAGCGGSKDKPQAALGTPQNPMVATTPAAPPTSPTPAARRRARDAAAAAAATATATGDGTAQATTSRPVASAGTGAKAARKQPAGSAQGEPTSGSGAAAAPNYQDLPRQRAAPTGRAFSPCNLVSQSRAEAILRGTIRAPLEAQQGPTCIYRTKAGASFVTVAVQQVAFRKLQAQLKRAQTSTVAGRTAYCAQVGNPTLYVPLGGARILTVSAPCRIAKAFAQTAVAKLAS